RCPGLLGDRRGGRGLVALDGLAGDLVGRGVGGLCRRGGGDASRGDGQAQDTGHGGTFAALANDHGELLGVGGNRAGRPALPTGPPGPWQGCAPSGPDMIDPGRPAAGSPSVLGRGPTCWLRDLLSSPGRWNPPRGGRRTAQQQRSDRRVRGAGGAAGLCGASSRPAAYSVTGRPAAAAGGRRWSGTRSPSDPYGADDVSPRTALTPPDEGLAIGFQPSPPAADTRALHQLQRALGPGERPFLGLPDHLGQVMAEFAPLLGLFNDRQGGPYDETRFDDGARAYEKAVLTYFAALAGASLDEAHGYVAASPREALVHGLVLARRGLPEPSVYVSEQAHYDVVRA